MFSVAELHLHFFCLRNNVALPRSSVQSLKLLGCQTVPVFHWSCSYIHFGSDMSLQLYNYEQIWVQRWENCVYLPLWDLSADCSPSTSQCSLSLSFLYWLLLQPIRVLKNKEIQFVLLLVKKVGLFTCLLWDLCMSWAFAFTFSFH